MRARAAVALVLLCCSAEAAQPRKGTALLETDLRAGKTTRIDAKGGDALDAEMDAVLGRAGAKSQSFSTKELDAIEQRLLADLRRERPRATPHLIVFVYPGRITPEKLKVLEEVFVDLEILLDPCERVVCRDAVARHIELVGRAVGKAERQTQRYKLVFKSLILRTKVNFRDAEVDEFRIPMTDAVATAGRAGGGRAWLDEMAHSTAQFEPLVAKAIARQAAKYRVGLIGAPHVGRQGDHADAVLKIRADRSRLQSQVIDALVAAAAGFRENPATPPNLTFEIQAHVPMKGTTVQRFKCLGQPVRALLDRQLDASTLWSTYVREILQQKGVTTMSFGDDDDDGKAGPSASDADAVAVLAENFNRLRDCARGEIARNPRFGGATITFRWLPQGRAADVALKEPGLRGGPLQQCLEAAFRGLRFPTFDGAARAVEYPLRLKR
jgi:hypothetical protein